MHWPKVSVYIYIFKTNQKKKHSDQFFFFLYFGFNDRFAETEAVAVLSILVSQFKITVKEEPQFATETFEQRKTRVLTARVGLTTT